VLHTLDGIGLRSGRAARVTFLPIAGPFAFSVAGVTTPLRDAAVVDADRATTLRLGSSTVATVEHLLAACAALGLHEGLVVEVSGGEIPLLDGASAMFSNVLASLALPRRRPALRVMREATLVHGESRYSFTPSQDGESSSVAVTVAFSDPRIAREAAWDGSVQDFISRIAPARTFAFAHEVAALASLGQASHVDPASVVVISPGEVFSAGAPFTWDEPARHKVLDLMGDLFLYGGPPIGQVHAFRPGHRATHGVLRQALAKGVVALLVGLLIALASPGARADAPPLPANRQIEDPYDVPLAPRPPTLPELTHPDYEISGETTLGVVTPNFIKALTYNSSDTAAIVQRLGVEIPISRSPRIYLGGTYEIAAGSPPGGGATGGGGGAFKLVPGNLDLYGRIVWATRTGMTFGGGVGVLLPTAQFGIGDDAAKVASAAQAIRPWDNAFFLNDALSLRGFVDVRAVSGPFVIQFREGMEGSLTLDGQGQQVAAILQMYIGYRIIPLLGIGLEAFETYLVYSPTVLDGQRATFTLSPSLRLMTRYVQPVLGFATSVGDPVFGLGAVDGFWAIRFGASVVWDPGAGGRAGKLVAGSGAM